MSDFMTDVKTTSSLEIMERGLRCLIEGMGVVDAEHFVSAIQRERFDYTKWHQMNFADSLPLEDFGKAAVDYAKNIKK